MVEKGDPPFTIAWSKDGEAIAGPSPAAAGFGNTGITGPRHTQTPAGLRVTNIDAHSSTIVIERVSAAHSGNYTCMARNSVAEVLWTAELIVRGKVEPMIIRIMRNHTCKDGRDRTIIYIYVFLQCHSLHRLLSPLCLILFLFFFFLHHCQRTILLYILPNNFFLPCIGWPRIMERSMMAFFGKKNFLFSHLSIPK